MNVGVCVNKEDFFYDLHSLVKAFFPDDEVQIFSVSDTEKANVPRDLRIEVEIPDYVDRTEAKNDLKRELYRTLSAYTGRKLPWGTLSGIRPTKIPMKLMEEGKGRDEILSYLKETYLVSNEKAELALQVAENERRILEAVGLQPYVEESQNVTQTTCHSERSEESPKASDTSDGILRRVAPQNDSDVTCHSERSEESREASDTDNGILRHFAPQNDSDVTCHSERSEESRKDSDTTDGILRRFAPQNDSPFCLYAHIPFCPSICLYCTFSASPTDAWARRTDEYLDVLLSEMQRGAERDLSEGKSLTPLVFYIGGGTPTALTAAQLDRLLTETAKIYDLSKLHEYTVEAGRPDSIDREKLRILKDHGVGRISVNPQTMNQRTLDLIGRRHTVLDTQRAFTLAREEGFDNINMDIILGLPGEEPEDVRHTCEAICQMRPDELTVHSLAVKRASRLTKTLREAFEAGKIEDMSRYEGLSFQNSEEIIGLAYGAARQMGMEPYYLYRQKNMKGGLENTGFALPGKEGLYNILIMEELTDIRAYGAGASSKYLFEGGRIERVVNPKDVKTYLERFGNKE